MLREHLSACRTHSVWTSLLSIYHRINICRFLCSLIHRSRLKHVQK